MPTASARCVLVLAEPKEMPSPGHLFVTGAQVPCCKGGCPLFDVVVSYLAYRPPPPYANIIRRQLRPPRLTITALLHYELANLHLLASTCCPNRFSSSW